MRASVRAFVVAVAAAVACAVSAQERTTSIAGRVMTPDGAAAENARVAVYAVRDGGVIRTPVATSHSSYDGRYEVRGLTPGVYAIGATPSAIVSPNPLGVARPLPTETLYPDVIDPQHATRITVAEGVPVEGIDIWLAPAPQRYTVGGRVYLPEGLRAREMVIEYGGPDVIRRGIWYVYDPDGLFEIEGVAQGPFVMLARAVTARGVYMGLAATMISVESVQDVRISMRRPGRVEGRVILEQPLPGGTTDLRISPVHTLLRLSALYPVQDAPLARDGSFQIPELLGTYTFDVQGLPQGWTVKRVHRAGQPAPDKRIVVGGEETVRAVEVFVGPGST